MRCKYCLNFTLPDCMGNGICFAKCNPDGSFIFPNEQDAACIFEFEPIMPLEDLAIYIQQVEGV